MAQTQSPPPRVEPAEKPAPHPSDPVSKTIPLITTLLSAANAQAAINWLIEQVNRVNSGEAPTRFEG